MKRIVLFGDGIPTANPLDEIMNEVFKNHGFTLDTDKHELHIKPVPSPFEIQSVLSNRRKNAFTVVWADGTSTVVHCQPGDEWDDEKALAMCFTKKALGNKGNFNDKFNDALDNKRKVIPGGAGIVAKHECHCDTPCEDCSCKKEDSFAKTTESLKKAGAAATKSVKDVIGLSNEIEGFLKKLVEEPEPIKVQRYDLFLMDPCGDKTEIYHQGTDEEIHKAMRAYRKKHYPALEANRTPYRVWMIKDNLMVDFGAGSYFMVPGMDHDTFVKGK